MKNSKESNGMNTQRETFEISTALKVFFFVESIPSQSRLTMMIGALIRMLKRFWTNLDPLKIRILRWNKIVKTMEMKIIHRNKRMTITNKRIVMIMEKKRMKMKIPK